MTASLTNDALRHFISLPEITKVASATYLLVANPQLKLLDIFSRAVFFRNQTYAEDKRLLRFLIAATPIVQTTIVVRITIKAISGKT